MSILQYALICAVLLLVGAGLATFIISDQRKGILQDLLSLSGAYLFGILILELMPTIFSSHNHITGIFFLGGFFLQIGMDFWTRGIEHGHLHLPATPHKGMAISLFAGLGLHALLDGLPFIGIESNVMAGSHQHSIYLGILLHKIAEGFTLFIVLGMLGFNKNKLWFYLVIFSLITPIGMICIQYIPALLNHISWVLGFAGGSLLHVAITILFESENLHHHGIQRRKLISIALGLGLAMLIVFL